MALELVRILCRDCDGDWRRVAEDWATVARPDYTLAMRDRPDVEPAAWAVRVGGHVRVVAGVNRRGRRMVIETTEEVTHDAGPSADTGE